MKVIRKYYRDGIEYRIKFNKGWQPGANTVAYYPLTSTTTVQDKSGNGYNLTNDGATFGTYQGVNCAYFNGSSYLYRTALSELNSQNFTISMYVYYPAFPTTSQVGMGYISQCDNSSGYRGFNVGMFRHSSMPHGYDYRIEALPGGVVYSGSTPQKDSGWIHCVFVYESGTIYMYIDGMLSNSGSKSYTYGPNGGLAIGCIKRQNAIDNKLLGGISNVIIENKVRTAQEITDYYNNTKSNYGL